MKVLLLTGLALMLIFEGMLSFLAPRERREHFRRIIELGDGHLRFVGHVSMLIGLALLLMVT